MRRGLLLLALLLLAGCARPRTEGTGYAAGVTVRPWLKTMHRADGTPIVFPAVGKPEATLAEVILAPGAETGWHRHSIQVFAFVLEGTLEVELSDGRRTRYTSGQALAEVVDVDHNGRNAGQGAVRLLVVYCGTEGTPLSAKARR